MTTVSVLLWRGHGTADTEAGPPDVIPARCWLCGAMHQRTYPRATYRKPTWTDDDMAAQPMSDRICAACAWCIDSFSALRRTAWLVTEYAAQPLARREIRGVLLAPPAPPFAVLVPSSFQLHLFHRARLGHDRRRFPVQFERALVWVEPVAFAALLGRIETLRGMGHTVGEIVSGRLRGATCRKHGETEAALELNDALSPVRGTALFGLAMHVSHGPVREGNDE